MLQRFLWMAFVLSIAGPAVAADLMVYTANQGLLSRLYVLDDSGGLIRFHEYDNTILVDLEVVDNEVYVADWVVPGVFRVDLETGELTLAFWRIDWFYLYGVAFDGTYFYADEWDLSRFTRDGTYDSTASFDEDVMGMAWDGSYLWTLNPTNQMRCWDVSAWPTVTEVVGNAMAPPTPDCRGLWFDGQYFWTAESLEDSLGWIYRFDHSGTVLDQWREPAFRGFAAATVFDPEPIFADDFEIGDLSRWSAAVGGP